MFLLLEQVRSNDANGNLMKTKLFHLNFALVFILSGMVQAEVRKDDFLAKDTRSLINLCKAAPEDPLYDKAIHFCHGYLVGAFHYSVAESANKPELKLVCFPDPKPSRNEAIDMFVAWAQKHPEFMNELPVETEFRFLHAQWPCQR